MPTLTKILANEVYQRIRQKMTVRQCVYYLNHAQNIITSAGNFPWDYTYAFGAPPPGVFDTLNVPNLDTGKKVTCLSANGLPIVRIRQEEIGTAASAFLNVTAGIYSVFIIGQGTTHPYLRFFPTIAVPPVVEYHYHQRPTPLTEDASSAVRWQNSWMDNLLCDFAEMEIKRILGAPDAAALEQRCVARLKDAVTNFSMERENSGPQADVLNAEAEKTQIGRV